MAGIRLAKLTDLSEIMVLAARLKDDTNYRNLPFNAVIARRTCKSAMTDKDSRVWVSTHADGRIAGFLVGIVGPMVWTHYLGASDLYFMAEAGGDLLLDAFIAWAKLRGVARIDMGISAGGEREAALKRAFRRKGFDYSGPCFHLNLLPTGDDSERHRQTAPQADAAIR